VSTFDWHAARITFDQGSLIDTGIVKLWVHDGGEGGEPLFFLGGWTSGHFLYDFVRPYMHGYRLLTWEPRGMGPSECPDPAEHPYNLDVLSDDLRDLLGVLGIERTHLWAGGFASYNVLRFAAKYPELVGAIVTYNDVWSGDPLMGYSGMWEVYRTIVEQFGTTGLGAKMLAGIYGVSDPAWFIDWVTADIEDASHAETVEALIGLGCLRADVRDDLAHIKAPTLVLRGERGWDGSILDERKDISLKLMRERMPTLEVATIPDSHPGYAAAQKPKECSTAVRDFLARHPLS
jgi:pimeloyl-ACP methyl ester carboxylesterase